MNTRGAGIGLAVSLAFACAAACGNSSNSPPPATGGATGASGATNAEAGQLEAGTGGAGPAGLAGWGGAGDSGAGGEETGGAGQDPIGGSGGEGGARTLCSAIEAAFCDDRNDCTLDSCSFGECTHTSLPNGTACDDRDTCTSFDSCAGGYCRGQSVSSRAQLVGQLSSFGGEAEVRGVDVAPPAAIVAPNTAVFVEPVVFGIWLRLVNVVEGNLSLVSSTFVPSSLRSLDGVLWGSGPGTHLLPLGQGRVALVMRDAAVRVYEVRQGALALLGASELSVSNEVAAALVRQNRMWLCVGAQLAGYEFGEDGVPVPLSFPRVSAACDSLGASPDGRLLYLGNQRGLWLVDVSDPSAPILAAKPAFSVAAEHRVQAIEAWENYLYVQTSRLFYGASDAFVLRANDFSEVARFPSVVPGEFALGAAPVAGGLLVQKLRYVPERGTRQLVAQFHTLDDFGLTLRDEWVYGSDEDDTSIVPVLTPSATGSLAILTPTRHVVSVEHNAIAPLHGREQGTLASIRASGDHTLAVYGPHSSHLVDLTDPAAPAFLSGGLFEPETAAFLRVDLPVGDGFGSLLNLPPASQPKRTRVTQLSAQDGAAAKPVGNFELDGAYATLDSDQGLLFQQSGNSSQGFNLRTFALPKARAADEPLLPDETSPLDTHVRVLAQFAFDVSARALVVAGNDVSNLPLFEWFEHRNGAWQLVDRLSLNAAVGYPGAVAVHGDHALVVSQLGDRVDLIRRQHDLLEVERTRDLAAENAVADATQRGVGNVLGFDGDRVYLFGNEQSRGTLTPDLKVFALRLSDLSDVANYTVPDRVTSLSRVGNSLAFGTRSTLLIASPECSIP